jgi:hypothetical protein
MRHGLIKAWPPLWTSPLFSGRIGNEFQMGKKVYLTGAFVFCLPSSKAEENPAISIGFRKKEALLVF